MTKQFSNYSDLLTFTRASGGHALRPCTFTETVVNGGFDTDANWSKGNGWSIGGGVASIDGSQSAGSSLYQSKTVTAGDIIRMTVEVTAITSGTIAISYANGTGSLSASPYYATSSTGTIQRIFYVTGSGTVNFVVSGSTSAIASVDNASISTVTFDESDGTLTLFEHPENIPRVEYDADGNRLGLLVEEARTNLVQYSTPTLDDWLDYGVTASTTTFPDGTQGNGVFIPTTANAQSYITTSMSVSNATTYTKSVYVKDAGLGEVSLHLATSVYTSGSVSFDFLSETITEAGDVVDSGYEKLTNGWYRIWISGTTDAAGSDNFYIGLPDLNSSAGNGIDGVAVFGAQLEEGSFPTSYIKTTGSTATRSADIASIPVADFGYNQKALTVSIEASHLYDTFPAFNRFWELSGGGDLLGLYGSSGSSSYVNLTVGGVQQVNFGDGSEAAADANTFMKYAVGLKTNDFDIARDGSLDVGDTSIIMSDAMDTLTVGSDLNGSSQLNGHIKSIKYYPRRLTNAQLVDLTS